RRGQERARAGRASAAGGVVEPLDDTAKIAHAVAVGILERARIDLIEDALAPPRPLHAVTLSGPAARALQPTSATEVQTWQSSTPRSARSSRRTSSRTST